MSRVGRTQPSPAKRGQIPLIGFFRFFVTSEEKFSFLPGSSERGNGLQQHGKTLPRKGSTTRLLVESPSKSQVHILPRKALPDLVEINDLGWDALAISVEIRSIHSISEMNRLVVIFISAVYFRL